MSPITDKAASTDDGSKAVESPPRCVSPHEVTSHDNFDDLFDTVRIKITLPVLLALLPTTDYKEYLQPNVNHHHSSDGDSFNKLHEAFKGWVDGGKVVVSTEFDAILMSSLNSEPSGTEDVAFNMFGVNSKKRVEDFFGRLERDSADLQKIVQALQKDNEKFKSCKTLEELKKEMKSVLGEKDMDYFLGFMDGLHRTKSLWTIVQSLSKEEFQAFMKKDLEVVLNLSFLKRTKRIEHRCLPEISVVAQEYSGSIMQNKQKTVGHTLFDCFNLFAVNSTATVHNHLSVLYCEYMEGKQKKVPKNCILHSTQTAKKFKDTPLTSRLQSFFVQFFYNDCFATWCINGQRRNKMGQRELMTQFSDRQDIQKCFPGAFNEMVWIPVLYQTLRVSHLKHALQWGDVKMQLSNKNELRLPLQCAMLFSLSRLFIFSPEMTYDILPAMETMQEKNMFSPHRLAFIQSIAYDATEFLGKYFNELLNDKKVLKTNWMVSYILRCNIERQIFQLYTLVETDVLQKYIDHCPDKFGLTAYEASVIKFLHQKEGILQQVKHDDEDTEKETDKEAKQKTPKKKEVHVIEPDDSPLTLMTIMADKLVILYAKYISFLLCLDCFHTQVLPILTLLLDNDKGKEELNKEISFQQTDPEVDFLGSCLLKQKISLGNNEINLDPESFINSMFQQKSSEDNIDPIDILLKTFAELQPKNIVLSQHQMSVKKGMKRKTDTIVKTYNDIVQYVQTNQEKMTLSFTTKTSSNEKRKAEIDEAPTPAKKPRKTPAAATQSPSTTSKATPTIETDDSQVRRSTRTKSAKINYTETDSAEDEPEVVQNSAENTADDVYVDDTNANEDDDNISVHEDQHTSKNNVALSLQQELQELRDDKDEDGNDEEMTMFKMLTLYKDRLDFRISTPIDSYNGEQDKMHPDMPQCGQDNEDYHALFIANMRSHLLYEVFKIYAFVLDEKPRSFDWKQSKAFMFTVYFLYDCENLMSLFNRLERFVEIFDPLLANMYSKLSPQPKAISEYADIFKTLELPSDTNPALQTLATKTIKANQDRTQTIITQRHKLVNLFNKKINWFPAMFQYDVTTRSNHWDRHFKQLNIEDFMTTEQLHCEYLETLCVRSAMDPDDIKDFLQKYDFETESFVQLQREDNDPTDLVRFHVPHSPSLFRNLLFCNKVIGASHVFEQEGKFVRCTLYDTKQNDEYYFQHNELSHVLVLKTENGEKFISPYGENFFPAFKVKARIMPSCNVIPNCEAYIKQTFGFNRTTRVQMLSNSESQTDIEFGDRNDILSIMKTRETTSDFEYEEDSIAYKFTWDKKTYILKFFTKDWTCIGDRYYDFDALYTLDEYYNKITRNTSASP